MMPLRPVAAPGTLHPWPRTPPLPITPQRAPAPAAALARKFPAARPQSQRQARITPRTLRRAQTTATARTMAMLMTMTMTTAISRAGGGWLLR